MSEDSSTPSSDTGRSVAPPPAVVHGAGSEDPSIVGALDGLPHEDWPSLRDQGLLPVRLPYDHGAVPLLMTLVYAMFLAFLCYYGSQWLLPQVTADFDTGRRVAPAEPPHGD